MKPPEGLIR